jgi:hypothetical protein
MSNTATTYLKEQLKNLHDDKERGPYVTDLRKNYSKGTNVWNMIFFYFTTYTTIYPVLNPIRLDPNQ